MPYLVLCFYQSNVSHAIFTKSSGKLALYNFDPLKPHFYTSVVKLGFTGVYIIFLFFSVKKHRLWVLVRTASLRQF